MGLDRMSDIVKVFGGVPQLLQPNNGFGRRYRGRFRAIGVILGDIDKIMEIACRQDHEAICIRGRSHDLTRIRPHSIQVIEIMGGVGSNVCGG